MEHKRQFLNFSDVAMQETAKIEAMIAVMRRLVMVLDANVNFEKEQSGVDNHSDANYSMSARKLAARRDNLNASIAVLEVRLSTLRKSGHQDHGAAAAECEV